MVTFQIDLKKFLRLKKLKILCHGHMLLVILTVKKLLKRFTKKEMQNARAEKVIKKKGDKLYVKWEGYDNSFNSSVDKNDIGI